MTATDRSPAVTESGSPVPKPHLLAGIVRALRPKQWLKNVLVFAAPVAAGVIREGDILTKSLAAFGAFCLISSGTYLLNDAMDVESDRLHPTKRHRPIASGVVPLAIAYPLAVVLIAGALTLGFVTSRNLGITLLAYLALTLSYSIRLKQVPILDIISVAAGFVLRAVAGGAATGVPISEWFFIVASFGALFMVSGKRESEAAELGIDAAGVRATLGVYSSGLSRLPSGRVVGCRAGGLLPLGVLIRRPHPECRYLVPALDPSLCRRDPSVRPVDRSRKGRRARNVGPVRPRVAWAPPRCGRSSTGTRSMPADAAVPTTPPSRHRELARLGAEPDQRRGRGRSRLVRRGRCPLGETPRTRCDRAWARSLLRRCRAERRRRRRRNRLSRQLRRRRRARCRHRVRRHVARHVDARPRTAGLLRARHARNAPGHRRRRDRR